MKESDKGEHPLRQTFENFVVERDSNSSSSNNSCDDIQRIKKDGKKPVDDKQQYEVEEILKTRLQYGVREFLIKWKGRDSSENTWQPEKNLNRCSDMLKSFKKLHSEIWRSIKVGMT